MAHSDNDDLSGVQSMMLSIDFLITNTQCHESPFSAIAELVDNAYDASAGRFHIDLRTINNNKCLVFTDNGDGATKDKLKDMLSLGYSNKNAHNMFNAIGKYGKGFKSGSLRLGNDVLVLTQPKGENQYSIGMLSTTYNRKIESNGVFKIPIVSYKRTIKGAFKIQDEDRVSLNQILNYSTIFKTEQDLLNYFYTGEMGSSRPAFGLESTSGTMIIVYNLRMINGELELDFNSDRDDIKLRPENMYNDKGGGSDSEGESSETTSINKPINNYDLSLRKYIEILFISMNRTVQMIGAENIRLRSIKIRNKELRGIYDDLVKRNKTFTFKVNEQITQMYVGVVNDVRTIKPGILIYHDNRLIERYKEHKFFQSKYQSANLIALVKESYLTPKNDKHSFENNKKYKALMKQISRKLSEYLPAPLNLKTSTVRNEDGHNLNASVINTKRLGSTDIGPPPKRPNPVNNMTVSKTSQSELIRTNKTALENNNISNLRVIKTDCRISDTILLNRGKIESKKPINRCTPKTIEIGIDTVNELNSKAHNISKASMKVIARSKCSITTATIKDKNFKINPTRKREFMDKKFKMKTEPIQYNDELVNTISNTLEEDTPTSTGTMPSNVNSSAIKQELHHDESNEVPANTIESVSRKAEQFLSRLEQKYSNNNNNNNNNVKMEPTSTSMKVPLKRQEITNIFNSANLAYSQSHPIAKKGGLVKPGFRSDSNDSVTSFEPKGSSTINNVIQEAPVTPSTSALDNVSNSRSNSCDTHELQSAINSIKNEMDYFSADELPVQPFSDVLPTLSVGLVEKSISEIVREENEKRMSPPSKLNRKPVNKNENKEAVVTNRTEYNHKLDNWKKDLLNSEFERLKNLLIVSDPKIIFNINVIQQFTKCLEWSKYSNVSISFRFITKTELKPNTIIKKSIFILRLTTIQLNWIWPNSESE